MTSALRLVLGDQLSPELASLRDIDRENDIVLLVEVHEEATHVRHHPKKIAFLFSAMRHFAEELRASGVTVDYVALNDAENSGSFSGELERAVSRHQPERIVVTEPGEYRVRRMMDGWQQELNLPAEIRDDTRFVCTLEAFDAWAEDRKSLRMEYFYREMRRATGLLMTDTGDPVGGQWNYDKDNRKSPPKELETATPMRFTPDETTEAVLALVRERFSDHFGDVEPFWFAVTRAQARRALAHFIKTGLPSFGDYQDAMIDGDDWLFHSALSQYLNAGLLTPLEMCESACAAYDAGDAPLNAVEGFVRQIIGWREYVRGVYWRYMPDYAERNALGAERPLPDFYWTGETKMNCMAKVIDQTRREAHSHHIQRLMVTGNFALLIGARPAEVCEWYLAVYADAYEWVEMPNVLGMALYADHGVMGSKPYAAGGAYIDRMSDFCKSCSYKLKEKTGPQACPFNYLYWNFLIENRDHLANNPRMGQMYRTLDKMSDERVDAIGASARLFLDALEAGAEGKADAA